MDFNSLPFIRRISEMMDLAVRRLYSDLSVVVHHGIADGGRDVAAALPSDGDDVRDPGFHYDLLGFHDVDESYRDTDHQCRFHLAGLDHLVESDQCGG